MAKMEKAGYDQGNMAPKVEDYQSPMGAYSQKDANKTTDYISRKNSQQAEFAKKIEKGAYKGRYS